MSQLEVFKMSGSGNDFVFVDGRESPPTQWTPERVRTVCERRTGVGTDGLMVVEPGSAAGAVRVHYFNRDGSRGELCGNACLCTVRLSTRLGLVSSPNVVIEADAGRFEGRILPGPGERAELLLGDFDPMEQPAVPLAAGEREARFGWVGVPHLVLVVDDLEAVDMHRARELRYHELFHPAGTNVNFVARSRDAADWVMRTYERGVEAETLACGTGAVAVAATLVHLELARFPVDLRSRSGAILTIGGCLVGGGRGGGGGGGGLRKMTLAGEGRLILQGRLYC